MLAFDVSVYKLPTGDTSDLDERLIQGDYHELLALWTVTAAPGCLSWIEDLVDQGKARVLNGNGYPMLYVGEAEAIVDAVPADPEITSEVTARLAACRDDEALVVTAWDLS